MFLLHFREGREEAAIRDPKSVLWAMRKDVTYLCGKLSVCHKRYGLRTLEEDMRLETIRQTYKAHHIFANKNEIIHRFKTGKPLSCFHLKSESKKVHVAFRTDDKVKYTSFSYDPKDLPTCETGTHFCRFSWDQNEELIEKEKLEDSLGALMLGNTGDHVFQRQFTLEYEDWEVLLCYSKCDAKGFALPDRALFVELKDML